MNKRGLGKGLKALLADSLEEDDALLEIRVSELRPNPYQPRHNFSEESLQELASSIKEHGVIQPVVVVKKDNQYFLVAGERRWRAAQKISLETIPAIIKRLDDKQLMEIALIENLQREDLNPIETAKAYQMLLEEFSLTQEELGERLGKSRVAITNNLRILKLPQEVQDLVSRGTISGGHAKALLGLKKSQDQWALAQRIETEGLSVRQVEELVKNWDEKNSPIEKKVQPQEKNLELAAIEEKLKDFFGTKVAISSGKKKGKIEIEYYTPEDLERILECLLENN